MVPANRSYFHFDQTVNGNFFVAQVKRGSGVLHYVVATDSTSVQAPVMIRDGLLAPGASELIQAGVVAPDEGTVIFDPGTAIQGVGAVGPLGLTFVNGLILAFRTGLDIGCLVIYR